MPTVTGCRVEGNEAVFVVEVRLPLAEVTVADAHGKNKAKPQKVIQAAVKAALKAVK